MNTKVQALRHALLATSSLGCLILGGAAEAQTAAKDPSRQLEEVVVTATRQSNTVNRVALSITAETQKNLDQQGIHNIADLATTVPALQINQLSPGVAQVSIRGISNTGAGAATVGFYLDDTALTKRGVGGGVATNNGTPVPALFDLERIEVLRGPQGTLYGGSSEGGTIRFITPQPSLTHYSEYVRSEVSTVENGDPSYELGVAVGGPIVQDKLGFRASVWGRHAGGYLDLVGLDSQIVQKNVNSRDTAMFRGALTWAPTDRSKVTVSYFISDDDTKDGSLNRSANTGTIVIPSLTYNQNAPPPCGNIGGFPILPQPVAVNGISTALGARCGGIPAGTPYTGPSTYTRPGATYAPITFGKYGRFDRSGLAPASTRTSIPALTLEYNFDHMAVKAVTSYIQDETKSLTFDSLSQLIFSPQNATDGGTLVPQGLWIAGPALPFPGQRDQGHFFADNQRHGISQELRFSSTDKDSPLTWVAGLFYADSNIHNTYENTYAPSLDAFTQALYGFTAAQQYGTPAFVPVGGTLASGFDHKDQTLRDTEMAAFAELNYRLTSKLKATAGVRVSRVEFSFDQRFFGPINGFLTPTLANGGFAQGQTTESPVTPKFGVQYELSSNDMVYATAAQGFRAGGVNTLLPLAICGRGLSFYGLSPTDVPNQYKSDSVWSYEAGGKFRLLDNRLQLNGSVFRIDWKDVQLTGSPGRGCGIPFTTNAGRAVSQGVELEAQMRVLDGLTVNAAFSYDDAHYTQDAPALSPKAGFPSLVLAYNGQKFDQPPWTLDVGTRYDHDLVPQYKGYVRVDFRYQAKRTGTIRQLPELTAAGVPGNANWTPDYVAKDQYFTNLRIGIEHDAYDINLFVNNLFDKTDGELGNPSGRSGCLNAACSAYSFRYTPVEYVTNTPRQIGIQIAFRH